LSFSGRWVELKIIMLNEIARFRKTNTACFLSYLEARSKAKNGPDHEWGTI
jgi:hypothetical protein